MRFTSGSPWYLLVLLVAACSDDGGGGSTFQTEPVDCGSLTCTSSEMCVTPRSVGSLFEGPPEPACAPIPEGCGGLELCSCPALETSYEGLSIVGCSLLGERTIYVADLTCGDRLCTDGEYCLIHRDSASGTSSSYECRPAPDACAGSAAFCGNDGCFRETTVDGSAVQLCLESDLVRAVAVSP